MNDDITFDFSDGQAVEKWLETVTEDVLKGVRHGVAVATNRLRDATLQGVRRTNPNFLHSSGKSHYGSTYYGVPLINAVRTYMVKGKPTGIVSIMGTPFSWGGNDGTFRLRFFEVGTKNRVQRSTGRNLGKITAKWFFRDAVNTVNDQAIDDIRIALENAIDEANRM